MLLLFFRKKAMSRICSALLCAAMLGGLLTVCSYAATKKDLSFYIEAAFEARRTHTVGQEEMLSNKKLISVSQQSAGVGTTALDWAALAMARYGSVLSDSSVKFLYSEGYDEYLAALKSYTESLYKLNNGKFSSVKVTDAQRTVLTLTALGGNAEAFGSYNEKNINLVADCTFNSSVALSRQGINGMIFALIAKNTKNYIIAEEKYTDKYIIEYLLSRRLPDGGWAISASESDSDLTALAVTALAPYYDGAEVFEGKEIFSGKSFSLTAKQAVDRAVGLLSEKQLSNGCLAFYGAPNCESTAQVIIALTGLGIDIFSDSRFIKSDGNLLDGLFEYRLADGSFTHSFVTDPQNTSVIAGEYNYMATDQASLALVALWRQQNGMNTIYDMRPDSQSDEDLFYMQLKMILQRFIELFRFVAFKYGAGE